MHLLCLPEQLSTSTSAFKWHDALAQLIDAGVPIMLDSLSLNELSSFALTCKLFNKVVSLDPVLKWRVSLSGLPAFRELRTIYSLEDTARFATPLTNEDLLEDALDTASRKEIKKRRKTLYLSHRKILCDWLVDVQHEYALSDETRQSSFLLLDRCLQVMSDLSRDKIQLLGATCIFIAAKFCETSHPALAEMVWVCDNAYTRQEHVDMEIRALISLQFVVRSLAPCSYAETLCQVLGLSPAIKAMADYLIDLFLLEHDAVGTLPSTIAGAAVLVSIHNFNEADDHGLLGGHDAARTFKDVSLLPRRSTQELRAVACRMQMCHVLDFFINGPGKNSGLCTANERMQSLGVHAVFNRHSTERQERLLPAAMRMPRRIQLMSTKTSGSGRCRCGWCEEEACGHALLAAFSGFVVHVDAQIVPSVP